MDMVAHTYRIRKITEIQREIIRERDKRAALCKKYQKCVRIISMIDDALVVTAAGLAMSGVSILGTIVAVPIAMAIAGTAAGIGTLVSIRGQVNRKLTLRLEKHLKIKTLAEAKLNSISNYVSVALTDEYISADDYSLILSEFNKFNVMKEAVRCKTKAAEDEDTFITGKRRNMLKKT